jgi:hypothetical protein
LFKKSAQFLWSFDKQTIYYSDIPNGYVYLFHELAHALLGHNNYNRDIRLLAMERDAWNKSIEIANVYDIKINDDIVQSNLDTYRDWLHNRSICPKCQANGMQINKSVYKCLVCNHKWHVNEAKMRALRRYNVNE